MQEFCWVAPSTLQDLQVATHTFTFTDAVNILSAATGTPAALPAPCALLAHERSGHGQPFLPGGACEMAGPAGSCQSGGTGPRP